MKGKSINDKNEINARLPNKYRLSLEISKGEINSNV